MKHYQMKPLALTLLASALVLSACDSKEEKAQQAQQQAHAPVVDVITAQGKAVTLTENLPGRLEASREAVIIPRVSGIVEKRLYQEGSKVNAGDVLYQLDDGTFQAALKTAEAALAQAKASRNVNASTVRRYAPLVKANAVSKLEYDQALANLKVQEANMEAAKASIDSAKINLGYTTITAPISGQIGLSNVTEGAYVNASQTTMATIQQMDPMYINITQSAGNIMRLNKALANGELQNDAGSGIKVILDDGSTYEYPARFLFTDQTVNAATSDVTIRAEVANPQGTLLPGLYVRVELPLAVYPKAYLIPQQAVTRAQQDTVLVVNKDGSYAPKVVSVAGQKDGNWIITSGLEDGMQVIVEGTSQLAYGAKKVQTRAWNPKGANAQAPASASQQQPATKEE